MNDSKNANEPVQSTTEDVAAAFTDPAAQSPTGGADPFVVLENLQLENTGLKDKLLRTLADMENLRRRTEREVADAKVYGVSSFAREMLNFADNLRRAIENVPTDARARAEPTLKKLIDGLELTERDFASRLERFGVKKLDPEGQKFDPNTQEALFEVPDESKPSGTVVQVVEPGYMIGERVLRPAKVGVSRGGPKGA
ncbi:nucleotide exchange factor GrpE [Methylocapsa palsarum]|uniref:Protein GrpE n=1 Tax=Methylocapsa palsarum TaxID=1612308 RepID=A0A1I4A357_9HYPH|nr:nucleotide exchange factor GrpE [Methylocapsa palsarum]SFK50775.1 molecular chaperone GrpE [Methylocapsa palsarum]